MKSIVQTDGLYCFQCRFAMGTETHHIFGAANRKFSDMDGLTIRVCRNCHEMIHCGQNSGEIQKGLHKLGQIKWEEYYGPGIEMMGGNTRQKFMERYGRNWL